MNSCPERIDELVECARAGESPAGELREHLAVCEPCSARWKAERNLTIHFGELADVAHASEAASQARRDARAVALLARFEATRFEDKGNFRPRLAAMKSARRAPVAWWLSAAAAVLLAIGAGYGLGARARQRPAPQTVRAGGTKAAGSVIYEISADAGSLSGDDFIAVPFALPLSAGEMVRVVHSALDPQVLSGMGIDVDPAWLDDDSGQVQADVVVGEDGFPRAVRIADTTDF